MKITWYGQSCFCFEEDDHATVVADPAPLKEKLNVGIVTMSHAGDANGSLKNIKGDPFVIDGAGEYELGNVFITGVQTNHKTGDERNTLFVFHYNDLTIAHMGGIDKMPNQKEVEQLGNINIALVPLGGAKAWSPVKAAELVSMLEPDFVIPMYYEQGSDKLKKFLKAMGSSAPEALDAFEIKSEAPAAADETSLVLLNIQ